MKEKYTDKKLKYYKRQFKIYRIIYYKLKLKRTHKEKK